MIQSMCCYKLLVYDLLKAVHCKNEQLKCKLYASKWPVFVYIYIALYLVPVDPKASKQGYGYYCEFSGFSLLLWELFIFCLHRPTLNWFGFVRFLLGSFCFVLLYFVVLISCRHWKPTQVLMFFYVKQVELVCK